MIRAISLKNHLNLMSQRSKCARPLISSLTRLSGLKWARLQVAGGVITEQPCSLTRDSGRCGSERENDRERLSWPQIGGNLADVGCYHVSHESQKLSEKDKIRRAVMKIKKGIQSYVISEIALEKDVKPEEDYVSKTIGNFGSYQAIVCPIAGISRLIVMWNVMCIVFLTPTTNFTCVKFKDTQIRNVTNSTCYADCIEYAYHSPVLEETLI